MEREKEAKREREKEKKRQREKENEEVSLDRKPDDMSQRTMTHSQRLLIDILCDLLASRSGLHCNGSM